MPKVSIIVPTYNVEMYLDECMTSLLSQTLRDIEIVCVNDGSTDHSLEILKQYAAKDSRIKIIDKPNGGYGHAMNVGLDHSTGDYIGILEPDDYVKPKMYKDLYKLAVKYDVDIIKADFYRFVHDEEGTQVNDYNELTGDKELYRRVLNPADKPEVFYAIMNTWSGIYKRSFLLEHHIRHHETPGASFQDNGFWFKTFCYAKRLYFVNVPYYMNRRDNPNSSVHNKEKVFCMNDEYAYIREFLEENPEFKKRYLGIYQYKRYYNYVASYYRVGEEYKELYLKRFQKEFREAMAAGELRKDVFTAEEWNLIGILLEDPTTFKYEERIYQVTIEKEKIQRLCWEIEMIQNSSTFKVGKIVMWIPCELKNLILKVKKL